MHYSFILSVAIDIMFGPYGVLAFVLRNDHWGEFSRSHRNQRTWVEVSNRFEIAITFKLKDASVLYLSVMIFEVSPGVSCTSSQLPCCVALIQPKEESHEKCSD
ncbi:hypothetical protein NPIL_362771 [Nephila pilipes]|uniref:Uncharacterized protein n=1 Tax=Nephila pilipes TaxID=299642 RepID=A0A8X6P3K7_NEPPI|nr:hypothetical protein NPIL_362771 [Nephila pilipes]